MKDKIVTVVSPGFTSYPS